MLSAVEFPKSVTHEIQRLLMQAIICTYYFTGLSQVVSIKTPLVFSWFVEGYNGHVRGVSGTGGLIAPAPLTPRTRPLEHSN